MLWDILDLAFSRGALKFQYIFRFQIKFIGIDSGTVAVKNESNKT